MDTLSGVRVLEVGPSLSAHFVGRQLAALGADVLKVEPPEGDPSRRRGPFVWDAPHRDGSALFLYLNLGKRGITLDRRTPTGREILGRLAADADIVLWGDDTTKGHEAAAAVEHGRVAIWMLVSPYGAVGPDAGFPAHSLNIYHAGGEAYLLPGGITWERYPDREPIKAPGYVGEFSAGDSMAAAILVARRLADPERGPLLIDASVQDALVALLRTELIDYAVAGEVASRASRSMPLPGLVEAWDGWIEFMPRHVLPRLYEWIGHPPEASPGEPGAESIPELAARISAWVADRTRSELYREGVAHGLPIGIYLSPEEILADPHMEVREFFTEIEHPYAGTLRYPTLPFLFTSGESGETSTRGEGLSPAPLLGQHNLEVLEDYLGYTRAESSALFECGIV